MAAPEGRVPVRPESPLAFQEGANRSGMALAAMTFRTAQVGGRTLLTTETRVFAPDRQVRRRFALYWFAIRPGSGLIRRMWLRAIRRRAEHATG